MTARPRAAIVVTGSELVRGERQDRNGPFLAAEALRLGLEPERITIVGDRPDDIALALGQAFEADLCLVSGGLGPTHDDRTVELVARVAGQALVVDPELEHDIEEVSRMIADRLRRPYADFSAGVRKQATRPEGATSLGLAGTAPGLVLETGGCVVVVLPGPPPELRRLWERALESEAVRACGRAGTESRTPDTPFLRHARVRSRRGTRGCRRRGRRGGGDDLRARVRDPRRHRDRAGRGRARAAEVEHAFRESLGRYIFSEDERSIAEIVLDAARTQGLSLATAESCTGGLVASRLTSVPGSSDVFRGGVIAYADDVKEHELGVGRSVLSQHGAVSAETARAMADGARARLGVDVAVAVTGIAGPGGATEDKPVGLVFLHAAGPDGEEARRIDLPGDREMIRGRAAAAALHLVRRLLTRSLDEGA